MRALGIGRLFRRLEQLGFALHHIAVDVGRGVFALGTVATVFGAEAALGVFQIIKLHLAPEVCPPNAKRRREQIEHLIVRRLQHSQRLLAGKRLAIQDAIGPFLIAIEMCGTVSHRSRHGGLRRFWKVALRSAKVARRRVDLGSKSYFNLSINPAIRYVRGANGDFRVSVFSGLSYRGDRLGDKRNADKLRVCLPIRRRLIIVVGKTLQIL